MPPTDADALRAPSRRDLAGLAGRLLVALSLGLAGLLSWRFAAWAPSRRAPVVFPAAERTDRPTARRREDVILVQDADRAWALSARCSHLGCAVVVAEDGASLTCPCHGSRYGLDGAVLHGPADEPLAELPITLAEDGSHVVEGR